jgi:hypothetical protein
VTRCGSQRYVSIAAFVLCAHADINLERVQFNPAIVSRTRARLTVLLVQTNYSVELLECINVNQQPAAMSRGNGITLVKNADVEAHMMRMRRTGRVFVMQQYLDAPLLLADGRKWDLRLYVVITSVEPLQAYMYNEGFARFCTHKYDRNAQDKVSHLTNTAVAARQSSAAPVTQAGECMQCKLEMCKETQILSC